MNTKFNKFIFGLCACCGLLSCSDFFDQEPDHIIFAEENHLSNATDTIYSVTGILNKLQAIGDRTVLLGEVRGDLVDITSYANKDIREIAEFNISDDNAYNVPRDYYAVINNCNYFIANVDTAMKNNRNEYLFMREYAAVKAIRAWTYLQLALNYNKVPFVTEPILSKQDAEKSYPDYDLQAICEYFINDLAPLTERWGNEYPRYGTIRGNDSRLFYFPINIVLGDLNLWLASTTGSTTTYREAAYRYYKYINERNGDNSAYPTGINYYQWEPGTTSWDGISGYISGSLTSENYAANSEIITMIAGDSIPAEGNYSELRNLFNSNVDNNYHVSIVPSQYCEDLKTLTGKLTVLYDDFNENYYININNYFKLQYQVYTRLNYNMRCFYKNITMACMNLEEVQKDFETLKILNSRVMMKEKITKTFDELSIFFKNWKRILFNENEIIKENLKDFFKLQKMENLAFIELIDNREAIRQKYAAEKMKLDAKKERLYKIMDFSKWEIEDNYGQVDRALLFRDKNYAFNNMCTKETQALENIHKMLGYANYMNNDQLKKIIKYNEQKFVENTKEFANKFYPSLNDGITLWSTLSTYI